MRFRLSVAGDVQMDREIEAIAVNAAGIDHVLHRIAQDLRLVTMEQFDTEGAFASGGWAKLKDTYLARKQKMLANGAIVNGRAVVSIKILRLTDRLKNSLLNKTDPEHIEAVFNHTLTWGTEVPYARFHQNPGMTSTLPRRRFLELPEAKRQAYARAFLVYVRTG